MFSINEEQMLDIMYDFVQHALPILEGNESHQLMTHLLEDFKEFYDKYTNVDNLSIGFKINTILSIRGITADNLEQHHVAEALQFLGISDAEYRKYILSTIKEYV